MYGARFALMILMKDSIQEKMRAITEPPSAGPAAAFTYVHVCCTLLLIGDEKAIGRIQLSKKLALGEGTVRTIIKHLAKANMIAGTRQGCILTLKGLSLYRRLRGKLSKTLTVDGGQLALDHSNTAVLVKGSAGKVRQGIEQRDAAVRMGGTGACTMLMRNGGFVMPMGADEWRLSSGDPLDDELKSKFHPKENDVIIIASAKQRTLADYAAIAAGLTLLN